MTHDGQYADLHIREYEEHEENVAAVGGRPSVVSNGITAVGGQPSVAYGNSKRF